MLLALGLVGAIAAIALIFNISLFWSRDRPEQQVTKVAGADLNATDLRLGDFRPIAGTEFLYAPLAPPSEYIGSSSSGGLGRAHNLLFFDVRSKTAHWLLPDNNQIIDSYSFLTNPPTPRYDYDDAQSSRRERVAIAILVELRPTLQNASSSGTTRTLALASAEGRDFTPIARAIGGLLGFHQPSANSILVFYVADGAAKVIDVDLLTRKVKSDQLLSVQ